MTVAGPRRICTGFLRRHCLAANSVAPVNAVWTTVAQIVQTQLGHSAFLPAALITIGSANEWSLLNMIFISKAERSAFPGARDQGDQRPATERVTGQ